MSIIRRIDYTGWVLGSPVREFNGRTTRIRICKICQRAGEEVTVDFSREGQNIDGQPERPPFPSISKRWVHVAVDVDMFGAGFRTDLDSCCLCRETRKMTGVVEITDAMIEKCIRDLEERHSREEPAKT